MHKYVYKCVYRVILLRRSIDKGKCLIFHFAIIKTSKGNGGRKGKNKKSEKKLGGRDFRARE